MRKLILKLFLLFLPFEIIVVSVNVFADPANIVSGKWYTDSIAHLLASGNNVENISNYDERQLQLKVLQLTKQAPNILVLGSSRIMEIGNNVFKDSSLLNIGVSHANINDIVALVALCDSLNLLPKKVVLNVDPYLIYNGPETTNEWQALYQFRNLFIKKYCSDERLTANASNWKLMFERYYTLNSFAYFKKSYARLFQKSKQVVINRGKEIPQTFGRLHNGVIIYPESYLHADSLTMEQGCKTLAEKKIPFVDEQQEILFKALLQFFTSRKIEVQLVMIPYHPTFYEEINKRQGNRFIKYEKYFQNTAKSYQASIIGSFDANKLSIKKSDFFDEYHCTGRAIQKFFN